MIFLEEAEDIIELRLVELTDRYTLLANKEKEGLISPPLLWLLSNDLLLMGYQDFREKGN